MKAGQGCIGMTCCPGDTICLASLRLRYPRCRSAQVAHRVWPGMGMPRQLTQSPSSLAVRLRSRVFFRWYSLRLWALGPVSVVLSAVLLRRFGIFGLGGDRFLGGTFGFGGTGFLPRAFRCLWPSSGFPWKRKGVLKCNSFRILCGGTTVDWRIPLLKIGLSPRGRGNQGRVGGGAKLVRSIPAWAGEPCRLPWSRGGTRVYPRCWTVPGGRCSGAFSAW